MHTMTLYLLLNPECMRCYLAIIRTFLPFLDVAKWVLNNQIARDEYSGEIKYIYKFIDDFESDICDFTGPLSYFKKHCNRRVQSVVPSSHSINSQYTHYTATDDSIRQLGKQQYFPQEYEAHNHMLHLMVSQVSFCL